MKVRNNHVKTIISVSFIWTVEEKNFFFFEKSLTMPKKGKETFVIFQHTNIEKLMSELSKRYIRTSQL